MNRQRSRFTWQETLRRTLSPRNWLRRHAQVSLESLGRLSRNLVASLMTAAVVGIALALPAGLYVLLDNLQRLSGNWDGQAGLSVFLRDDIPDTAAGKLAATLQGWPEVATVTLVTPAQALEEFRRHTGFADVLDSLDENPLPAVLLVTPAAGHSDPAAAGVSGWVPVTGDSCNGSPSRAARADNRSGSATTTSGTGHARWAVCTHRSGPMPAGSPAVMIRGLSRTTTARPAANRQIRSACRRRLRPECGAATAGSLPPSCCCGFA